MGAHRRTITVAGGRSSSGGYKCFVVCNVLEMVGPDQEGTSSRTTPKVVMPGMDSSINNFLIGQSTVNLPGIFHDEA